MCDRSPFGNNGTIVRTSPSRNASVNKRKNGSGCERQEYQTDDPRHHEQSVLCGRMQHISDLTGPNDPLTVQLVQKIH